MHDFDYDALQKKRIGRGAAHMKRGSKSKKCSLPSDGLTEAQWKRRNGPVCTYKIDAPMTWADFEPMPDDLKRKYLDYLYENYNATDIRISKMLGITSGALVKERTRLGIERAGKRVGAAELKRRTAMWEAFCNGVVGGDTRVTLDPLEVITPRAEIEPVEEPESATGEDLIVDRTLHLDCLSAKFIGEFDPAKFMQWVAKLPMPDGEVQITVEVFKK